VKFTTGVTCSGVVGVGCAGKRVVTGSHVEATAPASAESCLRYHLKVVGAGVAGCLWHNGWQHSGGAAEGVGVCCVLC
jgi:hypothetical protein